MSSCVGRASKSFKASSFEEAFFKSNQTYLHPSVIVGSNVQLENNVKIGPFCVIVGNVTIESGTRLHSHVNIGFPAQNIGTQQSQGSVYIGKNCEIREFVTIHASKHDAGMTKIGDSCYLMNFSHVAHDSTLENNVILINNANLGGHSYLEKNSIVMGNSAVHQFCRIGKFTALSPFSGIRQDLPPFCLFSGQPAQFYGLNLVGLKRAGFSTQDIKSLKHVTKLFYQDKIALNKISLQAQQEAMWGSNFYVQEFIKFIKESSRGVSRKSSIDKTT